MSLDQTLVEQELEELSSDDEFLCWEELTKKFQKGCKTAFFCCAKKRPRGKQLWWMRHQSQLTVLFLILTVISFTSLYFAYIQQSQINHHLTQKKTDLTNSLDDRKNKREYLKTHKTLNLSQMEIKHIYLNVQNDVTESPNIGISVLDLNSNNIKNFSQLTLPTLETLILNKNPLQELSNNSFRLLKEIQLTQSVIVKFNGNQFGSLKQLKLDNFEMLEEVVGNTLSTLESLTLPDYLKYFSHNSLPKIENFSMIGYPHLEEMENNTLRVNALEIKSPNLSVFEKNIFFDIARIIIQESNLSQIQLEGNLNLQEIILGNNNPIKRIMLTNHPNLVNIIFEGSILENFIIVNSNISVFPPDRFVGSNLDNLIIVDSNVSSCNLSKMSRLKTLHMSDNSLKSLNLPNNGVVEKIYIENTQIENIVNISLLSLSSATFINNTKLKNFSNNIFGNMNLIKMKASNITECQNNVFGVVKKIILQDKLIASNFLQQIDKSKVTDLTLNNNNLIRYNLVQFTNLKSLSVINNPIIEMELIGLRKLKNLKLDLPELKQLKIAYTNISSLENINFESVVNFSINHSPLRSFQNISSTTLKEIRINNTNIATFKQNHLPQLNMLKVVSSPLKTFMLEDQNQLEKLEFDNTNITKLLFEHKFPALKKLILNNNQYLEEIYNPVAPALKQLKLQNNTNFKILHLALNNLTDFSNMNLNLSSIQIINNPFLSTFENNTLPMLTNLTLNNVRIENLSKNNVMENLVTISLSNVKLKRIPYLGRSVQKIKIDNVGLGNLQIPDQYKDVSVVLYNEQLEAVQFSNVFNLKYLELHLQSLKHVCIINSSLEQINFGTSSNIQTLWLENTQILYFKELTLIGNETAIMEKLDFPSLRILQIDGQVQDIILPYLPELTSLSIRGTNIYKHPPTFLYPNVSSVTFQSNNLLGFLELRNLQNLSDIAICGNFYRLEIENTSIQTIQNLKLNTLTNLTLVNNPRLFLLKNNTLPAIKHLILQRSNFFLIFNTFLSNILTFKIVSSYLVNYYDLFDPLTISKIIIEDMNPELYTTPDVFSNVEYLELNRIYESSGILFVHRLPLQFLKVSNPLSNSKIYLEDLPLNDGLVISGDNITQLFISNANLSKLILDVVNIVSFSLNNTQINQINYISNSLQNFFLQEQNLTALQIQSTSLQHVVINLTSTEKVIIDAPLLIFDHKLPAVKTLHLKNTMLSEVKLFESFNLSDLIIETRRQLKFQLQNSQVTTLQESKIKSLRELNIKNSSLLKLPDHNQQNLTILELIDCKSLQYQLWPNLTQIRNIKLKDVILQNIAISSDSLEVMEVSVFHLKELSVNSKNLRLNMSRINVPNIEKLSLINVNISYWAGISPKLLKDITIINTNIKQVILPEQQLDKVTILNNTQLQTLNLNLNQKNEAKIQRNKIKQLQLRNYNNQTFQIDQPHMKSFTLIDSNTQGIYIKALLFIEYVRLENCTNLKSLILPKNSDMKELILKDLPNLGIVSFERMRKLKTLNFEDLPNLKLTNYNFPFLEQMYLLKTSIQDLNEFIIPNIQTIQIKYNNLKPIRDCNYSKLKQISIFNSKIQSIGINCNLESLTNFKLQDTFTTEIGFENLGNVINMTIQGVIIPSILNNTFTHLEEMVVSSSALEDFANNTFQKLKKLKFRNLPVIKIFQIGPVNTLLQELSFENCNYHQNINTSLYPSLQQLTIIDTNVKMVTVSSSLKTLSIIYNKMQSGVAVLNLDENQALQSLSLFNTELTSFRCNNMKFLSDLRLRDNQFLELFENNTFESLQTLQISGSRINVFSDNVYKKLETLILSDNLISKFQNNTLDSLLQLQLQDNNLTHFNTTLPNLIHLFIDKNNIASLTETLFTEHLPSLLKLSMAENPIKFFSNFQSLTLQSLTLGRTDNLREISNNNFPQLASLEISDSKMLRQLSGNTFPKLSKLRMKNNELMPQYLILAELANYKNQGVQLKQLMLEGVRMGNDTKKAIKAINDNTDIYD